MTTRRRHSTTYTNYMRSITWRIKRQMAFAYYGKTCVLCGATSRLQVHHRTYKRLGHERLTDLIVLCGTCHKRHHNTQRRKR